MLSPFMIWAKNVINPILDWVLQFARKPVETVVCCKRHWPAWQASAVKGELGIAQSAWSKREARQKGGTLSLFARTPRVQCLA